MTVNVQTLDLSANEVTVANTTTKTQVYSAADNTTVGVPGGTLGDDKSLRILAQCKASFVSTTAQLKVYIAYGLALETFVTFQLNANAPVTDVALMIEALLSSVGGSSFQKIHIYGTIELEITDWGGIPTSHNGGTEISDNDLDLKMYFEWNEADAGNSSTKEHVSVEILGEPVEVPTGLSEAPLTQLLSMSIINRLPETIYNSMIFYGEFLNHLDHTGVGTVVVARASAQNATWRDGGSHSVAANLPRFEYSGATPLGLLINSGVGETLTIPISNPMSDSNTLFWKENNITKYTTVNTNPFNGSGLWTGTNNIHISHVMKFNRVLTAAELSVVNSIYSGF